MTREVLSSQHESAPEGWEDSVERMKDHPDIDNPFALAHWMKGQGYSPHDEKGKAREVDALVRRAQFDAKRMEACGGSALGQLFRKGVKTMEAGEPFFATCDRDEGGRCKASGDAGHTHDEHGEQRSEQWDLGHKTISAPRPPPKPEKAGVERAQSWQNEPKGSPKAPPEEPRPQAYQKGAGDEKPWDLGHKTISAPKGGPPAPPAKSVAPPGYKPTSPSPRGAGEKTEQWDLGHKTITMPAGKGAGGGEGKAAKPVSAYDKETPEQREERYRRLDKDPPIASIAAKPTSADTQRVADVIKNIPPGGDVQGALDAAGLGRTTTGEPVFRRVSGDERRDARAEWAATGAVSDAAPQLYRIGVGKDDTPRDVTLPPAPAKDATGLGLGVHPNPPASGTARRGTPGEQTGYLGANPVGSAAHSTTASPAVRAGIERALSQNLSKGLSRFGEEPVTVEKGAPQSKADIAAGNTPKGYAKRTPGGFDIPKPPPETPKAKAKGPAPVGSPERRALQRLAHTYPEHAGGHGKRPLPTKPKYGQTQLEGERTTAPIDPVALQQFHADMDRKKDLSKAMAPGRECEACGAKQCECEAPKRESGHVKPDGETLPPAGANVVFRAFTPLREALGPAPTRPRAARVVLITEGAGNRRDRNYYPATSLRSSYRLFEGKKAFLNHPTMSDERERPERDVREQCGWFSDLELTSIGGQTAIAATLNFSKNDAGEEARRLVESALEYSRQFPQGEDVFCGLSLNASGPSHSELIDGEPWNWVDGIEACLSVDLVTFPARGGKIMELREADRTLLDGRVDLLQDLKKRLEAAGSTHEPETIAALMQAFDAFLGEELEEAMRDRETADQIAEQEQAAPPTGMPPTGMPPTGAAPTGGALEGEDAMQNQMMPGQPGEAPDPNALARREAAEADGFALYGDADMSEGDGMSGMAGMSSLEAEEGDGGGNPPPWMESSDEEEEQGGGGEEEFAEGEEAEQPPQFGHAEPDGDEVPPAQGGAVPEDPMLSRRRVAAEADNYSRYAGPHQEGTMAAETASITCEACGHEMAAPTPPAPQPAAPPPAMLQRESNPQAGAPRRDPAAAPNKPLVEAERAELVTLRTWKRQADLRARASAAITKHQADDFLTPEDVVVFREAEWDVLIPRLLTPPREYGTGERVQPAPSAQKVAPPTAAEVFRQAFDGDPA